MGVKPITILLMFLLLVTSVSAGYLSISNTITTTIGNDSIGVLISTTNKGNEYATNVYHDLIYKGIVMKSDISNKLNINGNMESKFNLPKDAAYFILKTHYSDMNNYPFSTLTIRKITEKDDSIKISASPISIKKSSKVSSS